MGVRHKKKNTRKDHKWFQARKSFGPKNVITPHNNIQYTHYFKLVWVHDKQKKFLETLRIKIALKYFNSNKPKTVKY